MFLPTFYDSPKLFVPSNIDTDDFVAVAGAVLVAGAQIWSVKQFSFFFRFGYFPSEKKSFMKNCRLRFSVFVKSRRVKRRKK